MGDASQVAHGQAAAHRPARRGRVRSRRTQSLQRHRHSISLCRRQCEISAQVNDLVQHALYMLWDIGFPGRPRHAHDVRKLVAQANGDLRTKTSLAGSRATCAATSRFLPNSKRPSTVNVCTAMRRNISPGALATSATATEKGGQHAVPPGAQCQERLRRPARLPESPLGSDGEEAACANTQAFVDERLITRDRAQATRPRLRFPPPHPHRAALYAETFRRRANAAPARADRRQLRLPAPHHPAPDGGVHARLLRAHLAALQPEQHALRPPLRQRPRCTTKWAFLPFHATRREEIDGFVLENGELELPSAANRSPTTRCGLCASSCSRSSTMPRTRRRS